MGVFIEILVNISIFACLFMTDKYLGLAYVIYFSYKIYNFFEKEKSKSEALKALENIKVYTMEEFKAEMEKESESEVKSEDDSGPLQ